MANRPPVIPQGATNCALLGQYIEIPENVVFTVEYSVRGAMHGVYGLLGLKYGIPPIYHGIADPKVAIAGLRTVTGLPLAGRRRPTDRGVARELRSDGGPEVVSPNPAIHKCGGVWEVGQSAASPGGR